MLYTGLYIFDAIILHPLFTVYFVINSISYLLLFSFIFLESFAASLAAIQEGVNKILTGQPQTASDLTVTPSSIGKTEYKKLKDMGLIYDMSTKAADGDQSVLFSQEELASHIGAGAPSIREEV
jgi:hypothetical protein